MVICTYEDRPGDLIGVRLLLLSLTRSCPDARVVVFCPEALHGELRGRMPPGAVLRPSPTQEVRGWSVKPWLLLHLLSEGEQEVVWMDADIVVHADFREHLGAAAGTLTVTGEPLWASINHRDDRVTAWGLSRGRELPYLVNSCVIRVTQAHRPLLEAWRALLMTREYLDAQSQPFAVRPAHVASDQDVLHALLTSAAHGSVDVRFLRPGFEIAHCHMADGYTVRDRLRHLWGSLPPLVHSQGLKPWRESTPRKAYMDVSPYILAALPFRHALGHAAWMEASSLHGKVLRSLSGGEPNLAGLLPAISMEVQRNLRLRTRLQQWLKPA